MQYCAFFSDSKSLFSFPALICTFFPSTIIGKLLRYKKMKMWWFHATLCSTFILSTWWIYKSWTVEEDLEVLMCIPPTALTKEVNAVRSKVQDMFLFNIYIVLQWILINNFLILFQYLLILVMLLVKSNQHHESRLVSWYFQEMANAVRTLTK